MIELDQWLDDSSVKKYAKAYISFLLHVFHHLASTSLVKPLKPTEKLHNLTENHSHIQLT